MPAGRPFTAWLPLVAVLLIPLPLTDAAVALALDHVMVDDPGATILEGLAPIDAVTAAGALTVTVWEIIPDRTPFASTESAV